VGFRDARREFISALEDGRIEAEPRSAVTEKNLLAIGEISPDEVANLIKRCRGGQHSSSPYDFDESIDVHVFKPTVGNIHWYIKGYIIADKVIFISVHKSEHRP
jgi:hypothetical protein